MAKAPDPTKMLNDMAAAFQVDTTKLQELFKTQAGYGEQMSRAALTAAEQSAELSAKWTRDTLAKLGDVSKAKDAPADYSKAIGDFTQAQAAMMSEQMSEFAEIARKLQGETVELIMKAAKDAQTEAQSAVKSAGDKVTDMAKKAGSK